MIQTYADKLAAEIKRILEVMKTVPMKIYAAVNPETGEIMAPTINRFLTDCIMQTDKYYVGCPIYECEVVARKVKRK